MIHTRVLHTDGTCRTDIAPEELHPFVEDQRNVFWIDLESPTPDELGPEWRDNKLHLPLLTHINGAWFGAPEAGVDMQFDFAQLIAHAAKTRPLSAGTIVGSGTVANQDTSLGASCFAEKRTVETLETGAPITPFMAFGDVVRIEMLDRDGRSVFGAIEQTIRRAG